MAFCKKCGAGMDEKAEFCPSCGASAKETPSSSDFEEKLKELNNTKDSTAEMDPEDVRNNKAMGILAYLSWLVLIPLFGAKDSRFARFHCNQGIVLAIAELFAIVVCGILSGVPFIGRIFGLAEGLIGLVCFILAVLGIINASEGKAKELPVIGKWRILK